MLLRWQFGRLGQPLMIVFRLSIRVPQSHRDDLLRSVGALLEPTRVLPGCLGCRLYIDIEKPDAFTLVEEWSSQVELDRHLTSSASKTLVAAMELSAEPPAIRFDTVAQRAGIEVMAAAWGARADPSYLERAPGATFGKTAT